MNNISNVGKKCTGCSSCVFSCPKGAITFKEDVFGFSFPNVDFEKCINCGKCLTRCPIKNTSVFFEPINVFAMNATARSTNSSSGGIATALISSFISSGRIVYCTQFSIEKQKFVFERFCLEHPPARINGSRYIQSDISNSFRLCKSDLAAGLDVLFLGTPCQVDGLIHFLNKYYDNLITVDILCHGVPSQKMLFDHLSSIKIEKPYNDILFRTGSKYSIRVFDYTGEILYESQEKKDLFLEGFQEGRILRDSCFACKYSKFKRVSDISLGDFWGKKANNNAGDSLVLVNTEKGLSLLRQFHDKLEYVCQQDDITYIIKNNPALKKPTKKSLCRRFFLKTYRKNYEFEKSIIVSRSLKKRVVELIRKIKIKRNRKVSV